MLINAFIRHHHLLIDHLLLIDLKVCLEILHLLGLLLTYHGILSKRVSPEVIIDWEKALIQELVIEEVEVIE